MMIVQLKTIKFSLSFGEFIKNLFETDISKNISFDIFCLDGTSIAMYMSKSKILTGIIINRKS